MTDISVNHVADTPFVFAQLCKELTTVEVSTATIFELFKDASGRVPYDIPQDFFVRTFYANHGNFAFDCDASGMPQHWVWLNNWAWDPTEGAAGAGGKGLIDSSLNLIGVVEGQWGQDLNVAPECWTVCSKLRITEELLKANHICSLRCNVCCSLCAYELAEALNSVTNDISGSQFLGSPYNPRTSSMPVLVGDRLVLSILFTNANTGVNPVNFQLHFIITAGDL